jgi:long-chain fatty acid transport protein
MKKTIVTALALLFAFAPTLGHAAGFRLVETGNSGQGQAHAVVAGVTDASSVYYNPAAMTEIENYAAQAGFQFVDPDNEYSGPYSLNSANETHAIPHVYVVKNFTEKGFALGVGLFTNFGTGTNWPTDGPFRYEATLTELRAATFNVNLAKKFSDKFSAAVGIVYMDSKVTYDSMYPFGMILGAAVPDGITNMEAESTAFGYNAAILFKPNDKVKIGVSYRSKVTSKFSGDATIQNFPGALTPLLAANGVSGDDYTSPVDVEIEYPDMLQVGIAYQVSDRLEVELDIDYTGWSSYDQLEFKFAKPLITPDGSALLPSTKVTKGDWENVTAVRIGANYKYNNRTTLRVGFYNDPSPVPDDTFTPRLPGSDRKLVSIGVGVKATDNFTIDVAYARLISESRDIDNDVGAPFASVDGEYKSSGNIFGATVGYQF